MNNNNIKNKLKVLKSAFIAQVVMDVLIELDMATYGHLQGTVEEYGVKVQEVLKKLEGRYSKLIKKVPKVKHYDIEQAIKDKAEGKY